LVRDVINGGYRDVGVRQTRVVARRWFKIELMYTMTTEGFKAASGLKTK